MQRLFVIKNSVEVHPRYGRHSEGSNRGQNIAYYFTSQGKQVRVCKGFFMKTLHIGDKFIRNTFKKKNGIGILEKDKRGYHSNKPKLSNDIKQAIRNHINSFPRVDSHYLRAQTSKQFLDGSLTLAQMYRLYVANHICESISIY